LAGPQRVAVVAIEPAPVPHWATIANAEPETRKVIATATENVHSKLAWVVLVLGALHAAAAIKHHVIDKDDVLARMLPLLRPIKKG
jgi:cytochrome b561